MKMLDANLMSAVRVIEPMREKIEDGGRIIGISSLASQTTPGSIPQVPDACRSALRGHFRPDGPPRLAPRKPPTTSTTIATQ